MKELNKILNKEQYQAVTHEGGPLLVLAGAGSGKTRVLTHRAVWLINERGVKPESIVLLTFTNKAAAEMKNRIAGMDGKKYNLGFAGTFHTFCAKLLREFGTNIGLNPNYLIYDSEDGESLMKLVLKELDIDPKQNKPGMFLAVISKMKNDMVSLSSAEATAESYFQKQVVKVWKVYQTKLQSNHAVDFDDLLNMSVDLLSTDRIREIINERLQWILVDEYQDINKAQFLLTKLLAGERNNITAVGDAAQAIYSFRGADYRNLLLLQEEYPSLTTVSLPKNYRSTQNILDAAYSVINNNTTHPILRLEATTEEGNWVSLFEAVDERDEAKYIVRESKIMTDLGNEVAILYRTNAQSRAFEDELMKKGIPYKLVGGFRFYNRKEVKDLLAYLKLVEHPTDQVSRKRIADIGKRREEKFDTWVSGMSLEKRSENPAGLLEEIINVTSYLDKFDDRDEEDIAKIENINELLAVASDYKNLSDFLETAALSEAEAKEKATNAKITLMTVHAAKGLEFECVFVAGLEEGIFPHSRSIMLGGKEEIEEERRLMYVAMTRAKSKLTLSFARSRLVYGGRHSSIPSRFLAEINEGKLKRVGQQPIHITEKKNKEQSVDEFGEKKRIIVQDWEIAAETKDDFAEIDNW